MMMFSPCVFCVLPCVTSTFTVSKLARIIKQASRVGGCERVFTPVRWRQVRLSCIKWRSTFFLYFFVRPSFGRQFVIRVDGCCANCVVGLAFLPSGHTTRKQRHYDAITTSCARWVGSSTSTSHRGRSDAHKLPTPGRPAGLTSQPNGHTT